MFLIDYLNKYIYIYIIKVYYITSHIYSVKNHVYYVSFILNEMMLRVEQNIFLETQINDKIALIIQTAQRKIGNKSFIYMT